MKKILLLTSFLLIVSVVYGQEEKLPNVIILYADDMGYGDLHIQNPKSKIPTPNLDTLAEEGIRFTDGHSSSGICTPSRYALLTGRYHWRDFHRIVSAMGQPIFKEKQYTLAQMFKEKGYATACIGKWHLGWDWGAIVKKGREVKNLEKRKTRYLPADAYDWSKKIPGGPLDRGFDYYFGDGTINFPPYAWIENDKVTKAPTTTMKSPKGMATEGRWEARSGPAVEGWDFFKVLPTLTEKAVKYVSDQKGQSKPFFLYMPFPSPHAPIIPNKEFIGKSKAGAYGDFVYQTDWCVGEILKALDAIGQKENTIVIFSADNGPEKYAYDRIKNFNHNSSTPFRGLKRDLYEGGHHVPFTVRWPKKIKPNQVSNKVISQVDLLKTFASIIKADLPKNLAHDSHDFANIWLGKSKKSKIRKATVQNTFEDRYAIRMGDWVYINHQSGYHSPEPDWIYKQLNYKTLKETDTIQLYNLKKDIGQRHNMITKKPRKVKLMRKKLQEIRNKETFLE